MARRGIVVDFVANVREFLKGTDKAADALDDVADALDVVAREGDDATDRLAADFQDLSRDAERSFRSISRDAQQEFRKVERASDDALKGTGRAGELGSEVGQEFAQNIGEGISSGKVGVAGATDTLLGTLGGVLPALGPAGAAFGVGALFVGSIVKGIADKGAQERERISALVSDALSGAVDKASEAGTSVALAYLRGQATAFEQAQTVADLLGLDDVNQALTEVGKAAEAARLDVGTVLTAIGGQGLAAVKAQQQVRVEAGRTVAAYEELLRKRDREVSLTGGVSEETRRQVEAIEAAALAAEKVLGWNRQNAKAVQQTVDAAQVLDAATRSQVQPAQETEQAWVGTADAAERAAAASDKVARNIAAAQRAAASGAWGAWERALVNAGTAAGQIRAERGEIPR